MLSTVAPDLLCPVCGGPLQALADDGGVLRTLRCPAGHSHDVAKQGHVSLLHGSHRHTGDDAAMVGHRLDFLGGGHYAPIADALTAAAARHAPREGLLLDIGGGPGWYAARLLESDPDRVGVTFDASNAAARRAAKAHPRLASVVADGWARYPVRDGSVGVATCVFAPRNGAETRRVLRPDGVLLVVTPLPDHLAQVRDLLGLVAVDEAKEERLAAALTGLTRVDRRELRTDLLLGASELAHLTLMGPSAHHVDADELRARLGRETGPRQVSLAVAIGAYRVDAVRE